MKISLKLLKNKILKYVIVWSMITIVVFAILNLYLLKNKFIKIEDENLKLQATINKSYIEQYVSSKIEFTNQLSARGDIINLINLNDNEDISFKEYYLNSKQILDDAIENSKDTNKISIFSNKNAKLVSSGNIENSDVFSLDELENMKFPYVDLNKYNGNWYTTVANTIVNREGSIIGYIVSVYNINIINDILNEEANGYLIVNRTSKFNDVEFITADNEYEEFSDLIIPITNIINFVDVKNIGIEKNSKKDLFVYSSIKNTNWIYIKMVSKNKAYESLNFNILLGILTLVVVSIIGVIIMHFLLKQMGNHVQMKESKQEPILDDKPKIKDSLTGLYNILFLERNKGKIQNRILERETKSMIIFSTIDNFKEIIENFGDIVEEIVLKEISNALILSSRSNDIIVRYSENEFLILLFEADEDIVNVFIKRVETSINRNKIISKILNENVILSFGYSKYEGLKNFEQVIEEAKEDRINKKEAN
ncbi:MAG: diguanylate cyclase domain-containing protein [Clostridiaceae bacterium]